MALLLPPESRFLLDERVAHLATASASGEPHVVPVCFAFRDGVFYIAIDRKPKRAPPLRLKRVRNLLENPAVSLVIDAYDEDWSRLAYLLAHGQAEVLLSGAEREAAIGLLKGKYAQYRGMDMEGAPVIKIAVSRVAFWRAAQEEPG